MVDGWHKTRRRLRRPPATRQPQIVNGHRHADPVQEFSQRVEEAWPLTLDPSPRAIHVSGPTARGEGRVRGHANSTVSGSLTQWANKKARQPSRGCLAFGMGESFDTCKVP